MDALATKRKLSLPQWLRIAAAALLSLGAGALLTWACALLTLDDPAAVEEWISLRPTAALGTALLLSALVFIIACLTRALWAGGLVVSLCALGLCFANYYKMLITSTPLFLSDIGLLGQAGNIAGMNAASITLTESGKSAIWTGLFILAVLLPLSRPLRAKWQGSLIAAAAALALFIPAFLVNGISEEWCFAPAKVSLSGELTQAYVSQRAGVVLGMWRSLVYKDPMPNYTGAERAALLSDADGYIAAEDAVSGSGTPNMIVILSESFFDVTKLPGVSYRGDPLSGFHSVCGDGVSGSFYTRTLGYGTCDIELEIMTGINSRFLSTEDHMSNWTGADFDGVETMPELFRSMGYYTAFLHTFDDSIYNRRPVYSTLGFDELFFDGDFAAIDPEAAAAGEDYWNYLYTKKLGGNYSDDYLAHLIELLYEEKRGDGPVLLWASTVENHTPFTADKYDSLDYPFSCSALSGEAAGVLGALTQGCADSSDMLYRLTQYFSDVAEPTVIVFFGDHRPGLPVDGQDSVYTQLGLAGANSALWDADTVKELYSTDYVIWANDPSLLPGEPGSRQDSSSNFLGLDVLGLTGAELDGHWRLVKSLSRDYLVYNWDLFVSKSGQASRYAPSDSALARKLEVARYVLRSSLGR